MIAGPDIYWHRGAGPMPDLQGLDNLTRPPAAASVSKRSPAVLSTPPTGAASVSKRSAAAVLSTPPTGAARVSKRSPAAVLSTLEKANKTSTTFPRSAQICSPKQQRRGLPAVRCPRSILEGFKPDHLRNLDRHRAPFRALRLPMLQALALRTNQHRRGLIPNKLVGPIIFMTPRPGAARLAASARPTAVVVDATLVHLHDGRVVRITPVSKGCGGIFPMPLLEPVRRRHELLGVLRIVDHLSGELARDGRGRQAPRRRSGR